MHELIEATTTRTNPGIDPTLHIWGWEIVVYLFLGGLVAGIFVLAAALELRSGEKPKGDALRLMPFAALGLLSLGMVALWLDLATSSWPGASTSSSTPPRRCRGAPGSSS